MDLEKSRQLPPSSDRVERLHTEPAHHLNLSVFFPDDEELNKYFADDNALLEAYKLLYNQRLADDKNKSRQYNETDKGEKLPLEKHFEQDMQHAAGRGYTSIVKFLIDKGVNVNSSNKMGHTPLHRSKAENHVAVSSLLLANGAKQDAMDNTGRTPSFWAKKGEGGKRTIKHRSKKSKKNKKKSTKKRQSTRKTRNRRHKR